MRFVPVEVLDGAVVFIAFVDSSRRGHDLEVWLQADDIVGAVVAEKVARLWVGAAQYLLEQYLVARQACAQAVTSWSDDNPNSRARSNLDTPTLKRSTTSFFTSKQ